MVFFINIYGRATDPPDKDKGNQIGGGGGDNDINRNRYADTHNKVGDCPTTLYLYQAILDCGGCQ